MNLHSTTSPRKVPFRQGGVWLMQAFYLVREQPLTWGLFAAIYILLQLTISAIPGLGQLLSIVTVPVFAGAFILAAHRARSGETLQAMDVFATLKGDWLRLLSLGGLYFGLLLTVMVFAVGILLGLFGETLKTGQAMQREPILMMVLMGIVAAVLLVASMSYWFAPAGIVLAGQSPLAAMRQSLAAGLANWGAMLYCGILLSISFLLAILPFGLGLLLWLPVMFVSVYVSWQDVMGEGFAPRS